MKQYSKVLKEVLLEITPSKKEIEEINNSIKDYSKEIEKRLKEEKIDATIFVGGSFAKRTMIKKGQYDVDIFIRFNEEYRGKDLSNLTERVLNKISKNKLERVHGSRDYFRINVNPLFFIELIPVLKVKNPKQAENITDLSYFHVDYIKKKIKNEKILEDIRIAKAFYYANKSYGAESYIRGFSGYSLELLIYYYGSFLKFVKAMHNIKEKEIIDIEKKYKNKNEILMNMNGAKMISPVVLIDPTYKERNALAALSESTFQRFKIECKRFLENSSIDCFKEKQKDIEKIKKDSIRKGFNFVTINISTEKQAGDVAGTKLLKFFNFLDNQIRNFYEIKERNFMYLGEKEGKGFFVVKPKKEIVYFGPYIKDEKNCERFKKKHKKFSIKKGKLYAEESFDKEVKIFLKEWRSINSQKIIEMNINNFEFE